MALTAVDFVDQYPNFHTEKPAVAVRWEQVRRQAINHALRIERNSLFDVSFPNETEEIKNYRDSVRRDITTSGVRRFISKLSRIFIESGIEPDPSTLSDQLSEWLNADPFEMIERSVDLSVFAYEILLPSAIIDPNAIVVPFPINGRRPEIPPSVPASEGGLPANQPVTIKPTVISSDMIVAKTVNVVSWEAGMVSVKLPGRQRPETFPFYIVADRQNFYRWVPDRYEKGELRYRLELWYFHNIGAVPVESLGGYLTEAVIDGQFVSHYYESFIVSFFHLADEVVTSFSNDQAVRIQHVHPKMIMSQIPCGEPSCDRGKIKIRDNDGKVTGIKDCSNCDGSGYIKNPGPYQVLVRPNAAANPDAAKLPVLEYVTPPSDSIEHSFSVPWSLLEKANRSIGLDLLLNEGVESGTAKLLRLDDLHDILRQIASAFFGMIERFLWKCESLLVVNPDRRSYPTIQIPTTLTFKDATTLKEQAQTALPVDRFDSTMEFIRKKYRDDPTRVWVYEMAIKWSPLLLVPENEMRLSTAAGAYSADDLKRRDVAFIVFNQIADRPNFNVETISQDSAFEIANTIFAEIYPPPEPIAPPIPDSGSGEPATD